MIDLAGTCQMAQNLARNCGWHVFPCREDKKPSTPHGFKDASSDPACIAKLWRQCPGELIGIATGELSGISVLDVDVKYDSARAWWHQHEHLLPITRAYRTRRGGLHLYFRHAAGVRNVEGKPEGIDVRGQGGYVISWWCAGFECLDHELPHPWPDWLTSHFWPAKPNLAATPKRKIQTLSDAHCERIRGCAIDMVRRAPDGQKHHRVRKAARLLARNSHTGEGWSTAWGANRRGMARTDERMSVARVGSRMSNTASPAALLGCILTVRCLVRVRWQHVAIAHERGRIRSARDRRMTSLP